MLTYRRLQARNGFVLEEEDGERVVYQEDLKDDPEAFVAFIEAVIDTWGPQESRYSPKRVRVVIMPGDKWEGEIDSQTRTQLEWLYEEMGYRLGKDHQLPDSQ